jgi:hypothetical protein
MYGVLDISITPGIPFIYVLYNALPSLQDIIREYIDFLPKELAGELDKDLRNKLLSLAACSFA